MNEICEQYGHDDEVIYHDPTVVETKCTRYSEQDIVYLTAQ